MVKIIIYFSILLSSFAVANTELLSDPTKPLDFKQAKAKRDNRPALPRLQSILMDAQQPTAIINNKLYKEGQKVRGYVVTKIKQDKVLLRYKQKNYQLTLYSQKEQVTH